jgi:hypothetical protein
MLKITRLVPHLPVSQGNIEYVTFNFFFTFLRSASTLNFQPLASLPFHFLFIPLIQKITRKKMKKKNKIKINFPTEVKVKKKKSIYICPEKTP